MTSSGQFIANVPSLPSQVASYIAGLKGGTAAAGALAVVWAGANDFFDGQTNPAIPAKNIAAAVSALMGAGVKNFLIPNLPDLSKTPYGLSSSTATQQGLQALSVGFDKALRADLGPLTNAAGVRIHALDSFGLFQQIQANPAQFNLSNVTEEGILTGNPSAPGYLFWDGVHPTTAGHEILAEQAARAPLATPEPGSLALLASGLLGLLGIGWPGLRGSLRRPTRCPVRCTVAALCPWLVLLGLFFVLLSPPNLIAEDPPAPRNLSGVPQMEGMTVLEPSPPAGAASSWPRGLLTPPDAAPGEHPLLGTDRPSAYSNGGPMFDLDVMLGMLMGIRAQAAVYRNPYLAFVVEGFYGAILDELATGEGAGGAGRVYFHRTDRAGYNSILIGPGVGAYCHFHHDLWMVAPTVDVSWVRPIGDLASWELGLNAGVGVGVAGDSETNRVGRATPLISVFMGYRF
jgi:lysophospholipase L1-like esterase